MAELEARSYVHLLAATRDGILGIQLDAGEPQVYPHALHGVPVRRLLVDGKGVLLAAGTRDRGVQATRDGGRSWREAAGAGAGDVRALAGDARRVWAGLSPAALLASGDGGSSFAPVGAFAALPRERWGKAPDEPYPSVPALLAEGDRLAVAVDAAGLWLSADGGASFRDASGDGPRALLCLARAAAGADGTLLAGTDRGLFRVDAERGAWTRLFLDPDRGVVTAVAVGARDPRRLVAAAARFLRGAKPAIPQGADAGLYASEDGGATWAEAGLRATVRPILRGPVTSIVAAPGDPARVFAAATSGEILESRDGGRSFAMVSSSLPSVMQLAIGPAFHG